MKPIDPGIQDNFKHRTQVRALFSIRLTPPERNKKDSRIFHLKMKFVQYYENAFI
jgi:hypothetical protein